MGYVTVYSIENLGGGTCHLHVLEEYGYVSVSGYNNKKVTLLVEDGKSFELLEFRDDFHYNEWLTQNKSALKKFTLVGVE